MLPSCILFRGMINRSSISGHHSSRAYLAPALPCLWPSPSSPQYLIPMLGMLLGNACSGVAVGLSTVLDELSSGAPVCCVSVTSRHVTPVHYAEELSSIALCRAGLHRAAQRMLCLTHNSGPVSHSRERMAVLQPWLPSSAVS